MTQKTKEYDSTLYHKVNWDGLGIKDKIAYILAILLICSGIIMAFLCFFMSGQYNVNDGVLFYCSESFISGGGLLSVSLYVKNKMFEMRNYIERRERHHEQFNDYEETSNIVETQDP
jgi:hypothetical protein